MNNKQYREKYFTKTSEKRQNIFLTYLEFIHNSGITTKNKIIADFGCARGAFLSLLNNESVTYGYDVSKFAIEYCKQKVNGNSKFKEFDLNTESFTQDHKFDIITMFDVIEHLDNFLNLKNIFNKNLQSDGYLIITTPNANSLTRFINPKSLFSGEYDKTHTILFTPYTLDFFLRRSGFKKIKLFTPFAFYKTDNFITRKFLFGGQIFAIYQKNE
jgi:2-polyprenyl-3-methyl-5-hydroxy-6-metoxy-1,4-benzoquinol methylase